MTVENIPALSIAIIGMACRFPGAANVCEFWHNLRNGVDSIAHFTEEEMDSFGVTPDRYRQSLDKIRAAAASVGRGLDGFVTAHLTFITVGRDYEGARSAWVARLSKRYAQDFGPLADKYGVIGTPEQCAARIAEFRAAGCAYFLLNAICDPPDEREQLELIAAEVLPRLRA